MKNKKNKGFTLIELLVVIAIIGILAAIGLSALTSARKKARDSKRKSDMREVSNALELYYADKGYYPQETTWTTAVSELIAAGYLAQATEDSLSPDRKYCYGSSQTAGEVGLYYRAGALLEVANDPSMVNDGGVSNTMYEVGNALGTTALQGKVTACGS